MLKAAFPLLMSAGLLIGQAAGEIMAAQEPPVREKQGLVCPVMKAHLQSTMKAAAVRVNNATIYTCCASCPAMLKKEPAKYLTGELTDPVTGKPFQVSATTPKLERKGELFLFTNEESKAAFVANPARYVKAAARR